MNTWTTNTLRQAFLDFFQKHDHNIFPSSSLTKSGDSSVLLTTAGMQQFKPYYIDPQKADEELKGRRAATAQKCFRTTDIDEVGDETHHTFFEMLGNFSFGDYFKEEAITLAYKLLTEVYGIDKSRITVTIFQGSLEVERDEESMKVWKRFDFSEEEGNMKFAGMEDNFWGPTGDEGPCGPTTEIYIDGVEIWNIVFNEFFYPGTREELLQGNSQKELKRLSFQGVDTGMGIERLAVVMEGVKNNYEIDAFTPLLAIIEKHAAHNVPKTLALKGRRIIADHMRGAVFLMTEGLEPSNVKAGYILRRILRRSIRYAYQLKLPFEAFRELSRSVADMYKNAYPEVLQNFTRAQEIFEKEYRVFGKAIKKGTEQFETILKKTQTKQIKGSDAFMLYATFGFPLELIEEMAKEQGKSVNTKAFEQALAEHKEKSKPNQSL